MSSHWFEGRSASFTSSSIGWEVSAAKESTDCCDSTAFAAAAAEAAAAEAEGLAAEGCEE